MPDKHIVAAGKKKSVSLQCCQNGIAEVAETCMEEETTVPSAWCAAFCVARKKLFYCGFWDTFKN